MEPLGKLIGIFPDFEEAIKKRQKKLLDYDRLRSGVRKLVDKPAEDASKLPKVFIKFTFIHIYRLNKRQIMLEICMKVSIDN